MNPLIKLENVSFKYPDSDDIENNFALNDFSLEINEGEFVALLGHNGSGKSTAAKLINMILTADSGKIYIDGKNILEDGLPENDIYEVRKNVGMVFQNPDNQIVATVVEEDVAFGPENLGIEPQEIRRRVDEALETVNMTAYKKHSPHQLSGGQKQRVAIAGIIAMFPECIIFDESTAMLDPGGRRDVMDTIEYLNREKGITVLHITHNMDEAVRADRVVVINDGRVFLDGTPKEVFSRVRELRTVGLDVPQVTELFYDLSEHGIDIDFTELDEEKCAEALAKIIKTKESDKEN